jgi:hypothetical protein
LDLRHLERLARARIGRNGRRADGDRGQRRERAQDRASTYRESHGRYPYGNARPDPVRAKGAWPWSLGHRDCQAVNADQGVNERPRGAATALTDTDARRTRPRAINANGA